MDCPQCSGTLTTYALSGREASVCEDCGYVGIAAEHRGDPRRIESWDDALRRFYGTDEDASVEVRPPLSRPSSDRPADESWDDALRRFYERRTSDEDERADEKAEDGVDGDVTDEDGEGTAAESAADAEATDGSDAGSAAGGDDPGTEGSASRSRPSQSSAGDS